MEYEAREKGIRDYNQSIYEAEQRGIHDTAKNLLSLGVSTDIIAAATNLSVAEIKALDK